MSIIGAKPSGFHQVGLIAMQDWKKDLDALVAETMAFVASIKTDGLRIENQTSTEKPATASDDATAVPLAPASSEAPQESVKSTVTEREEIRQRLAKFKANQERWNKERWDYADATLRKIKPEED
jgi:hypothetical protein